MVGGYRDCVTTWVLESNFLRTQTFPPAVYHRKDYYRGELENQPYVKTRYFSPSPL